jgi:hypothetical protein
VPQGRPDPEQLAGCDVQQDDLVAPRGGSLHPDVAIQKQENAVDRQAFGKHWLARIISGRPGSIQNFANLRTVQAAERRKVGQQAFIHILHAAARLLRQIKEPQRSLG